ncbi:MAG: MFS transporter [Caldilinea sp. CFX5]|nr:MFS transporter [Caldilinea sp. CFX5]
MTVDKANLWRNPDFVKLWSAHPISAIGSKVTFLALPLTAALVLQATPVEMGYLAVAGSLPGLLFGLPVGVWVDRRKRRSLLILADIGRGLLLLLIPLAVWVGLLQMPLLYGVIFFTGILSLLFGAADHAYLPTVVQREQLVAANSRLAISRSAAEIAGPTLAGWLIQVVTAPVAILVDALSFLLSGLLLGLIRQAEAPPVRHADDGHFFQEISAGFKLLYQDRTLWAITIATAIISFFNAALEAIYLLYMTRNLALSAWWIGIIFGAGSVGFLVGALLPGYLVRRLGLGSTMILGLLLLAVADIIFPLARGPQPVIIALLTLAQVGFGFGITFYNVSKDSLQQTITPEHMLGRMSATLDFTVAALIPLGALAGGLLGEWLGLRTTLLLAASGELLAVVWLFFSPVRTWQHDVFKG